MTALALALAVAAAAGPAASPARTPPGAEAHPLSFSSRAAKAEVRLGEPFEYAIEVRHRPEEAYALPASLALKPFDSSGARCRREEAKGEVVTTCAMSLALFALGPADVPAVPLRVETPAGPATLDVPGPRVNGVGVLDPAAPTDAVKLRTAPPVPLLVPSWKPLLWALGALAAAVVAVVLWRVLRARAGAPPPPLPPHERLAQKLDALAAARLPQLGRGREHVIRLSAIVREHLGAVTFANALDQTTLELRALLERRADPRLDAVAVIAFLEGADVVKFARAEAGAAQCEAGMRFARELQRRTALDLTPSASSHLHSSPLTPTLSPADAGEREPGMAATSTPTSNSTSTSTPTPSHPPGCR